MLRVDSLPYQSLTLEDYLAYQLAVESAERQKIRQPWDWDLRRPAQNSQQGIIPALTQFSAQGSLGLPMEAQEMQNSMFGRPTASPQQPAYRRLQAPAQPAPMFQAPHIHQRDNSKAPKSRNLLRPKPSLGLEDLLMELLA